MLSVLILSVLFVQVQAAASATPSGAGAFAWMAGCWRQESPNRVADEMWMTPAGGVVLGVSRTVANGRTVAHEFMQIREDAGRVVFIAQPAGQAEATFTLLTQGPRDVVFENPAHDFPQRVMYRLDGDTLVGRIEGSQNGKPRSVDYPMRRTPCPK